MLSAAAHQESACTRLVQHGSQAAQQRARPPDLAASSPPAALPEPAATPARAGRGELRGRHPLPSTAAGVAATEAPDEALPAAGVGGVAAAPPPGQAAATTGPAEAGAVPEQAACAGGATMHEEVTRKAPLNAAGQPGVQQRASLQPDGPPRLQRKGAKKSTQGAGAAAPRTAAQAAHERVPVRGGAAGGPGGGRIGSAGSSRALPRARRERQRAFARLEPSVPGSVHTAGGYTGVFAFPDSTVEGACAQQQAGGAAGAASGRAPESSSVNAGLTAGVPGALDAAAEGPGARVEEGSAGDDAAPSQATGRAKMVNSSGGLGQSGPASPGTPESPNPKGAWAAGSA